MKHLQLTKPPVAHTAMLIRKPVSEVFEALVDPAITSHFWFSRGSDRLAVGKTVQWDWEIYDVSIDVTAKTIEQNRLIVMEWPGYSGRTTVTWKFREVGAGTFVDVEETGWTGTGDELLKFVCESTGGFSWALAGMKAFLEHGLELNLVADRFPKKYRGALNANQMDGVHAHAFARQPQRHRDRFVQVRASRPAISPWPPPTPAEVARREKMRREG